MNNSPSFSQGVVFRPLDPAIEEPVYLVWRKHGTRSEFARRFADVLHEAAAKIPHAEPMPLRVVAT
jgi:DNA-binding transcriptional LysR family regulator